MTDERTWGGVGRPDDFPRPPDPYGRTPYGTTPGLPGHPATSNLADVLERVLDRGVVIAGDIRVNLLDVELLTIKLRLIIASVDRAREMGIDWWEADPSLSRGSRQREEGQQRDERIEARLQRIEHALGVADGDGAARAPAGDVEAGEEGTRRVTEPQAEA